jgi:hypothetical protein
MRWTAASLAFVVAIAVSGCSAGGDGDRVRTAGPPATADTTTTTAPTICPSTADVAASRESQPALVAVTARQDLTDGLRVDPPPTDAHPLVGAEEAYDAVRKTITADPGPHPTVELGLLTDETRMIRDGKRLIDQRLSWVFVFSDTTVGAPSGPMSGSATRTTTAPPCHVGTIVTPVDANTGEVMMRASEGRPGA